MANPVIIERPICQEVVEVKPYASMIAPIVSGNRISKVTPSKLPPPNTEII